ncbi:hypothetical protein LptCag_0640 [Leptospirillum ferriphilum]|uniref:Uncharacterized protein n=2 Tax=Leptospirillum ferriphilum TaxID=178606 RepID=A0A094X675_9BACT|nr:hypothetical protein LFML04_2029 [Leptospirillum ferriphilum ML-04]KGA94014.1 hypothetical protein LptCag_0640 [Leptospirillum ferriphilum]
MWYPFVKEVIPSKKSGIRGGTDLSDSGGRLSRDVFPAGRPVFFLAEWFQAFERSFERHG